MTQTYKFFHDPGHGWLEVPRTELITLGIAHKISGYSYQNAALAYLEEDCDLTLFADAKGWRSWQEAPVTSIYQKTTPIRDYCRFQA